MPQQQPRYVELPNGSYLEWPEGVSADQFKAKALKVMGQPKPAVTPPTEDQVSSFKMATGHDPKAMAKWFDPKESLWAAKEMGSGFGVDTGKGLYDLFKPGQTSFEKALPPGNLQAYRIGKQLYELVKTLPQVPGAVKDLSQSGYALPALEMQVPRALGQGLGAYATGKVGEFAAGKLAGSAIPTRDAVRTLTDAVNPPAKNMAEFEQTMEARLPRALDYAKRKGFEINSRESLARAMEGAGDEVYDHYYQRYIAPIEDLPVSRWGRADTTVGQLERRLSTINATLFPKFQKGGIAAQASIAAGDAAALSAEAATIRGVLNRVISKKLNIPMEEVAAARATFGSMRDVADKIVRAINDERHATNLERRGVEIPSGSKEGLARYAIRKLTAKNPDKIVASTIKGMEKPATPKPLSQPNPSAASPKPRNPPPRAEGQPVGTVETSSPADLARVQGKVDARRIQNELRKADAELQKIKRTSRQPLWQQQGESEMDMALRNPHGQELPTTEVQATVVKNLREQFERQVKTNDPMRFATQQQLLAAEEKLAQLDRARMRTAGYGKSQAMTSGGEGGANYTAEQLAELKKRLGLQ